MDYTITIEGIEMNHIKISSEIAPSRFYDMNNWTLGAAVENYVESEIIGENNYGTVSSNINYNHWQIQASELYHNNRFNIKGQ